MGPCPPPVARRHRAGRNGPLRTGPGGVWGAAPVAATVVVVAGLYLVLAGLVVVAHFAYLGVLVVGGLAARRWRRLLPVHLALTVWALGAVALRYDCPLTALELRLRDRAGLAVYDEGFLRHYVRGVLFPEALTPFVVLVVAGLIVAGWVRLASTAAAGTPAWGSRSPTRTAAHSVASSRSQTRRTRSSRQA